MRPALRYYGAKFRLFSWIIGYFSQHYCYVEPFGGSAAVLLQKSPSPLEVYNDLDGNVVNFFRMLRDRPEELIRAIELTPYARDEYRLSRQPTDDDLERARRFYVYLWQSVGATPKGNSGWRFQHSDNGYSVAKHFAKTDHLWQIVGRLKQVQIENDDAIKVVERFDTPETLFYCDPPYLPETRERNGRYREETTAEYHCQLAGVLNGIQGKAIISGYPSQLYNELYAGWRRVEKSTTTNGKAATECLWISPQADRMDFGLFAGKERV
jgi:DNA adenine methylase